MMADFELGERSAWKDLHETHSMKGCVFHVCQAVWKYVTTHGMSVEYVCNACFRGIIWMAKPQMIDAKFTQLCMKNTMIHPSGIILLSQWLLPVVNVQPVTKLFLEEEESRRQL